MEKDQDIRNPRPSIRTLLMQNGDDLPVDCPECARLRAEVELTGAVIVEKQQRRMLEDRYR